MNPQDPRRPDETPETESFPPVMDENGRVPYQPQYLESRGEPEKPGRSVLAGLLLAALIFGALALGVWIYTIFLSSDEEPTVAPGTATEQVEPTPEETVAETPEPAPEETTVTVTEETPEPEPEPEQEPEPTPPGPTTEPETTTPQTGGFRAPASAEQCAANVNWRIFRASDATSCGFAENVAIAMAGNSGQDNIWDIEATSPDADRGFPVRCIPEGANSFTCRGGDNAVVILEDRAVRD